MALVETQPVGLPTNSRMATRPVLGAALVGACTAARAAALATAESESAAPAQPPRNSPATVKQAELPRTDVDLARAIAVMERYHRMSQEALRANATDVGGGSGGPEVLVSAGGELAEKAEAESSGAGNMALSLSVPPVEVEAGATGEAVHVPETVSPELGGVGTVATPAAVDDAVAVVAPPPQPVAPKPKKKKLPRIPAERLFSQFDAGGDVCVPHVIVGGGTAAWSAVQAIRRRDPTSAILVVTEEPFYPYNRTPLSKELWAPGAGGLFTSEAGTRGALEYSYLDVKKPGGEGADTEGVEGQTEGGSSPVSILRSTAVVGLDIDARTVSLANGHQVQYDKLLLATGGTPRSAASVCDALEANEDVRRAVSVFRTLEDFRELRSELGPPGSSVAVVGGGFLGTELAVAMASEGRRVSLLCAEPGVLYKVLPRYLSQFLARRLEDAGVNVVESAVVVDANCVSEKDQRVLLSLGGADDELGLGPVDKVVVCTGIVPRVELAASAGLEVDSRNGGIVVNDQMNAEANVFVAGDVASFWDRALGRRRVEHWGAFTLLPPLSSSFSSNGFCAGICD